MAYKGILLPWDVLPTESPRLADAFSDATFAYSAYAGRDISLDLAPSAASGVTEADSLVGPAVQLSATGGSTNYLEWASLPRYDPPAGGFTMFFYGQRLAGGSANYDRVFTRDVAEAQGAGNRFGFLLTPSAAPTPDRVYFYNESGTTGANIGQVSGNPVSPTDRFGLYLLSHDGSTARFYFDGALQDSAACSLPGSSSRALRIGASTYTTAQAGGPFNIAFAGMLPRAMDDDEASEFGSNPSLFFAPQRIWVPVSAGISGAVLTGAGSDQASGVGSLTARATLTSAGAATSAGVCTLTARSALAGSTIVAASGQGALTARVALVSYGAGAASGAASLQVKAALTAAATASSSGLGTLSVGSAGATLTSSGGVAGFTGSAALTVRAALVASTASTAAGQGTLTTRAALSGAGASQAAGSASLSTGTSGAVLIASAFSSATGAASLATRCALSGAAQSPASGSAVLSIGASGAVLVATLAIATASATAALTVRARLAASGSSAASGVGSMSGGLTAPTPGYIASAPGRSWRAAGASRSFVAEWGDR